MYAFDPSLSKEELEERYEKIQLNTDGEYLDDDDKMFGVYISDPEHYGVSYPDEYFMTEDVTEDGAEDTMEDGAEDTTEDGAEDTTEDGAEDGDYTYSGYMDFEGVEFTSYGTAEDDKFKIWIRNNSNYTFSTEDSATAITNLMRKSKVEAEYEAFTLEPGEKTMLIIDADTDHMGEDQDIIFFPVSLYEDGEAVEIFSRSVLCFTERCVNEDYTEEWAPENYTVKNNEHSDGLDMYINASRRTEDTWSIFFLNGGVSARVGDTDGMEWKLVTDRGEYTCTGEPKYLPGGGTGMFTVSFPDSEGTPISLSAKKVERTSDNEEGFDLFGDAIYSYEVTLDGSMSLGDAAFPAYYSENVPISEVMDEACETFFERLAQSPYADIITVGQPEYDYTLGAFTAEATISGEAAVFAYYPDHEMEGFSTVRVGTYADNDVYEYGAKAVMRAYDPDATDEVAAGYLEQIRNTRGYAMLGTRMYGITFGDAGRVEISGVIR